MGLILSRTFQGRSRLSAKAPRLYAEQSILAPVHVDSAIRYRFYSEGQLLDVRLITLAPAQPRRLADFMAAEPDDEVCDIAMPYAN